MLTTFSIDNPIYMGTPPFLQVNLDSIPSMIFQKPQPPINKEDHTILHMFP